MTTSSNPIQQNQVVITPLEYCCGTLFYLSIALVIIGMIGTIIFGFTSLFSCPFSASHLCWLELAAFASFATAAVSGIGLAIFIRCDDAGYFS